MSFDFVQLEEDAVNPARERLHYEGFDGAISWLDETGRLPESWAAEVPESLSELIVADRLDEAVLLASCTAPIGCMNNWQTPACPVGRRRSRSSSGVGLSLCHRWNGCKLWVGWPRVFSVRTPVAVRLWPV